MLKDGTGRSNALPVMQIVLGTALAVIGVLESTTSPSHSYWIGWLISIGGLLQIAVGVVTIRRNQRLDREEMEARGQSSASTRPEGR